jgi:hypothetical protein
MSVSYIENLREAYEKNAAYAKGNYGAYQDLMKGIAKISDFFRSMNGIGIVYHEEHTGNSERTFKAINEERTLHISVFCTPTTFPAFSLVAVTYTGNLRSENNHILETTDVDALIGYLYSLICSVDPERGKWIKL